MAVTAGNGIVADGLQSLYRGVFGFLTTHLEVGDFAVVCDHKGVAEDGRIAKLLHKRARKLGEGIADNDNLCHFPQTV